MYAKFGNNSTPQRFSYLNINEISHHIQFRPAIIEKFNN
jgi:hypothetical protein